MVAVCSSKPHAAYTSFESGDKVAAYGGLGILAAVLGVKYGKAAAAGLVAVVLLAPGTIDDNSAGQRAPSPIRTMVRGICYRCASLHGAHAGLRWAPFLV